MIKMRHESAVWQCAAARRAFFVLLEFTGRTAPAAAASARGAVPMLLHASDANVACFIVLCYRGRYCTAHTVSIIQRDLC